MDAEQGSMFSFGVSAGLLGRKGCGDLAGVLVAGYRVPSADVNGDGLVDYVSAREAGASASTRAAASRPKNWLQVRPSGRSPGRLGDETYNKTYYLEEPFRAWKALPLGDGQ